MKTSTPLLCALLALGCGDASDAPGRDANTAGTVAEFGGGNPWDDQNPGDYRPPRKADETTYEVPTDLPELVDPHIVVSLEGLSVELIDEATGFLKVYPTGVGARGSSGRSYTPTGSFQTWSDPDDGWYWYKRRYSPSYFAGLPFMRLTAQNSRGNHTYGFHGPITGTLIRDFVSHGCMRMQAPDIVELFYMMIRHPGAAVDIQTEERFAEDGTLVDVTPADADPVAAYRERLAACDEVGVDETLRPGDHEATLCALDGVWRVQTEPGRLVTAYVEASRPVGIALATGEGEASRPFMPWQGEVTYTASAQLEADADGAVSLTVLGVQRATGPIRLVVEVD